MDAARLSGTWNSRYYYHDDAASAEHALDLQEIDGVFEGRSRRQPDGSYVTLHLECDAKNNTLTGTWCETTAPDGEYKGQCFHGAIQLIFNQAGDHAEGLWVGFNSQRDTVKSGRWTLTKTAD